MVNFLYRLKLQFASLQQCFLLQNHPFLQAFIPYHNRILSFFFNRSIISEREQIVVYEHKAESEEEIDIVVGDHIKCTLNQGNGYSYGLNNRTGKTGRYPSYKVRNVWATY